MIPPFSPISRKVPVHHTPNDGLRHWLLSCLALSALFSYSMTQAAALQTQANPLPLAETLLKPTRPPESADNANNSLAEELLKMTEFFDTTLPGTLKKYNFVFSFTPRIGDVSKVEYVRMPFKLRYGLSERWEVFTGITPFCPNPFNSGLEHRWGLGETRAGVRYDWGRLGKLFDQVTIGIEGRTPLGKPPYTLIDYHAHLVPFINTSRPLPWQFTTFLLNLSYDRGMGEPWRAEAPPPPIVPHESVFTITPSLLYKPGEFGAFVEYKWLHIEDKVLGTHLAHEIKAGPIWDPPLWRTQGWGLPGKWQVELGGRIRLEDGLPDKSGVTLRVRWRTTKRELFAKETYKRKPRP